MSAMRIEVKEGRGFIGRSCMPSVCPDGRAGDQCWGGDHIHHEEGPIASRAQ
ncbi:hypothetical protein HAX54_039905, partial [Datura stramonium]|nr:hypothetical protein [Datura stramonium]